MMLLSFSSKDDSPLFSSLQATMLKKRKHKIKRRNTEPSVNHPLVLATPSAGPGAAAPGGGGTAAAAQEKLRRHNEQLQKQQMQSGTDMEFMDMDM